MPVVATAGHVDHGKSTLVRALTGTDPDRLAEERRRGLTIELGYAWTTLPSGRELAFVDVPGHERFIATMLAGLGPTPAVVFVVAADAGWSRQSAEHLAAIDALDVRHGLLAVTRTDLADAATTAATADDAHRRLQDSSLGDVETVLLSATTGRGLDTLRASLDRMLDALPAPDPAAPVRFWIDRSFTVRGAGTVVTGTLDAGTVSVGDRLTADQHVVTVRGVESMEREQSRATPTARVALNLRGVPRDTAGRGTVLTTPDAWHRTVAADVRTAADTGDLPAELTLHVGTAERPVRVRPLDERHLRLTWSAALPLRAGDRGVLRDPGRRAIAAGVLVLDADPPALRRRHAAHERGAALAEAGDAPTVAAELARREIVRLADLRRLGVVGEVPADAHDIDGLLVDGEAWQTWLRAVGPAVADWAAAHPLDPAVPLAALRHTTTTHPLTDAATMRLARAAGMRVADGRVTDPGASPAHLGAAEAGLAAVTKRLTAQPFTAPERDALAAAGLGPRELAAAERHGRLLRLPGDVVLLPEAPALALAELRGLPQPFTTSQARQALHTTRRVAVPLLEYLDERGDTERLDGTTRRVSTARPG